MPCCIYCFKNKSDSAFKKREHVLPQSFGKFKPNNLILKEIVCDDCNQFFGDKIEIFLARDTIEGVHRYIYKIRPKREFTKSKRLKFKIAEGEMKGVIVRHTYSQQAGESDLDPVMQVCFYDKVKKEYDCFEPEELPTLKELQRRDSNITKKQISYFAKPEEEESIIDLLKNKGFNFKKEGEIPIPKPEKTRGILTAGTVRIDPIIYRGFSKIAFNYLAYCEGKDFVFLDDFNPIRNFIRYGHGTPNDYFFPNDKPILFDDQKFKARTAAGHLLVVEWQGYDLVGRVSLFNLTTYKILLCKRFNGIWRNISHGHYFDMKSREVSKLLAARKTLLI